MATPFSIILVSLFMMSPCYKWNIFVDEPGKNGSQRIYQDECNDIAIPIAVVMASSFIQKD
jgi:hypothetical protein